VLDELVIINQPAGTEDNLPTPLHGLQWKTCLRRISLLNQAESNFLPPAASTQPECYRGKDAYRFLLEVVCGLRSPLVGETAVMGQFKEFCFQTKFPNSPWGQFLRQFTSDLLVDAKRVRHHHLEGMGSQSYGGLVRQHLKDIPATSVLGSGKLTKEILPWLLGKTEVTVFSRNPLRAESLLEEFPQTQLRQFTMANSAGDNRAVALVIAAPLSAGEIEKWIGLQTTHFVKALDLRGEAETDPVRAAFPVIRLSDLFDALKNDRPKLTVRVAAARDEIKQAALRVIEQAQFRPFGWEDLCA
jgi:glutamyl-tRNA reductase